MRLKSFTANSMKDAMKMVRDALGEDAIIIATREQNGGKSVRVTAAIEDDAFHVKQSDNEADWLYDDDDDEASVIEELTETMLRHSVPEEVSENIISCATIMGLEEPRIALLSALENLYQFSPLPVKASAKPIMLVGPPGAGKTLAVAKLAARCAMNGLTPSVITTDTVRAGGIEQLEAFTRLMKVDLLKAESAEELTDNLQASQEADQIIIDTAGANPFDNDAVRKLARFAGVDDMDIILTLPAGGDSDECGEVARIFASIGAKSFLPTRTDVARRLGGILSAAHLGGLSFADMSNTAKVAEGLVPLTPKRLTQLLMPRAEDSVIHKVKKAG